VPRATCAFLALLLSLAAPLAAQQPRDGRPPGPPPAGTSIIWGVVTTDERQPKPLRRARVTLTGAESGITRTLVTNDDGSFSFDRLPSGRYTVRAAKDGHVAMNYGARRPLRNGAGIELGVSEAQRIALRLPRGGVITGTVLDAEGQPMGDVDIVALASRFVGGERRLSPAGLTPPVVVTDDRGEYRIFGLPAGDYVVVARPRRVTSREVQVISAEEVRRALAYVRAPAAPSLPGIQKAPLLPPRPAEPRRAAILASVYYPGVADAAAATRITVGPAEERTGFDFVVRHVPTATISGFVSGDGPPPSVTLRRIDEQPTAEGSRSTRAGAQGAFTFQGISPGRYLVLARSPSQWASTEVVVNGDDVGGIALSLQPGLTIAGKVAFEGALPPPMTLAGIRVPIPATLSSAGVSLPLPPIEIDASGAFAIRNIVPGRYRIGNDRGIRAPLGRWWLKSIVVNGRDVLDRPLELRQTTDDAVVTFSDRASVLTGTVLDEEGRRPPSSYYVVVFGTDPSSWFFNSRRVAVGELDGQGRYRIDNLPPGTYFITVHDDFEQGEWFDPDVLQRLVPAAQRFTVDEYARKTYDLVVGHR
jgi:protocatechuate 3,4-dioxygenase beta subunit